MPSSARRIPSTRGEMPGGRVWASATKASRNDRSAVGSALAATRRATSAEPRNISCTSGAIEASARMSRSLASRTLLEVATRMSDSSHSSSRTRASQARARAAHRVRRSGEGGSASIRPSSSRRADSRRSRLGAVGPVLWVPACVRAGRAVRPRGPGRADVGGARLLVGVTPPRRRPAGAAGCAAAAAGARRGGWPPACSGRSSRDRIQVLSRSSSSAAPPRPPRSRLPASCPHTVSSSPRVELSSRPRSSSRRAWKARCRSAGRAVAELLQLRHGGAGGRQRRLGGRAQIAPLGEGQQRRRQVPAQGGRADPARRRTGPRRWPGAGPLSPSSLLGLAARSRASARPGGVDPELAAHVLAPHVHHAPPARRCRPCRPGCASSSSDGSGSSSPARVRPWTMATRMPGSRRASSPRASSRQRVTPFWGSWAMLAASEAAARRHSVGPWFEVSARSTSSARAGSAPPSSPRAVATWRQTSDSRSASRRCQAVAHRRPLEHAHARVVALLAAPGRLARRPLDAAGPPAAARAGRRWRDPRATPAPARAATAAPAPARRRWCRWRWAAAATGPPGPARPARSARAASPAPAPGPAMTKVAASPSCSVCSTRRPRSRFSRPWGRAAASSNSAAAASGLDSQSRSSTRPVASATRTPVSSASAAVPSSGRGLLVGGGGGQRGQPLPPRGAPGVRGRKLTELGQTDEVVLRAVHAARLIVARLPGVLIRRSRHDLASRRASVLELDAAELAVADGLAPAVSGHTAGPCPRGGPPRPRGDRGPGRSPRAGRRPAPRR